MTTQGPVFDTGRAARGGSGARWAIGCLVALAVVFVFVALAVLGLGGGLREFDLSWGDRVGFVRIAGPMESPGEVVRELKDLRDDPRVKAIVLRLDTPGGTVGTAQEIRDMVISIRAEGVPVVASMGDVAASGGYYVAAACDSIVSNPGTLTGSIGVIFSYPETGELIRKIGLRWEVVKSGEYKDVGSMTRPMTPAERELLEGIVQDTHEQFIEVVVEGRRLPWEEVSRLADGRIMTGRQAKAMGLVDRLGSLEEARRLAARLGGMAEGTPMLSKHRERFSFVEFLTSRLPLDVERLAGGDPSPRLEYRWR